MWYYVHCWGNSLDNINISFEVAFSRLEQSILTHDMIKERLSIYK